jgi:tetratricopeptide (TPR) repeat protein
MYDARLIPALDEYVIGSLPWGYKMLTAVAGFSGDRDKGIEGLKSVAEHGVYNRFDADALLAAIYRREKRPAEAIAPLDKLIARFPRSYILRIELAEMYGDIGNRAKALGAVNEMDELRRSGAVGYAHLPEALLHSTRGGVLMQLHDLDAALAEMKFATAGSATLEVWAAGIAWVRLGQIYDLKGQRQQAVAAYQKAMQVAPVTDAFEDAKRYVSSKYKEPA